VGSLQLRRLSYLKMFAIIFDSDQASAVSQVDQYYPHE